MKITIMTKEKLKSLKLRKDKDNFIKSQAKRFLFKAIAYKALNVTRQYLTGYNVGSLFVRKFLLKLLIKKKQSVFSESAAKNTGLLMYPTFMSQAIIKSCSFTYKSTIAAVYNKYISSRAANYEDLPILIKKQSAMGFKLIEKTKSSDNSNLNLKFSMSRISEGDMLEKLIELQSDKVRRNESSGRLGHRSFNRSSRVKERTKLTPDEIFMQYENNIIKKTIEEQAINAKIKRENKAEMELICKHYNDFSKYVKERNSNVFLGKESVLAMLKNRISQKGKTVKKVMKPYVKQTPVKVVETEMKVFGHRLQLSNLPTVEKSVAKRGKGRLHLKTASVLTLMTDATSRQYNEMIVLNTADV